MAPRSLSPSYFLAVAFPAHHHLCAEALLPEIVTSSIGVEDRREGTGHRQWVDCLGIVHDRPEDIEVEEEVAVVVAGETLLTDLDVQYPGRAHDLRGVPGQGRRIRVLLQGPHRDVEEADTGGVIRRRVEVAVVVEEAEGVQAMTPTATAVAPGAGAVVRAVSLIGPCSCTSLASVFLRLKTGWRLQGKAQKRVDAKFDSLNTLLSGSLKAVAVQRLAVTCSP
jgi:hypothetical protein